MTPNLLTPASHLRVLIVPDVLDWITGTIAKRIAYHNSDWIDATIISGPVLRDLIKLFPDLPEQLDLVHFQTHYEAEPLIDFFIDRVPFILTIHHVEGPRCVALEPRCDAVAVSCSQWHDSLVASGVDQNKLVKLPYGVNSEQFRPATVDERTSIRKAFGLLPNSFVVGFCAKRSSDSSGRKGIDVLVKAVEALGQSKSNMALLIVGPGWEDVANQARKAGLTCIHLPYVSGEKAFSDIYRTLDVYWVTSRIEGGPVPLLEAMSCGVCCVTTPVGMAIDVVRDSQNGFFVPFNDPIAVVQVTELLAADPALRQRIGAAARQSIAEGYDWGKVSQAAKPLYSKAINRFQAGRHAASPIRPKTGQLPAVTNLSVDTPRLAAIPDRYRRWVTAREHYNFLDMLRSAGEDHTADQISQNAIRFADKLTYSWRRAASDHYVRWGWIAFMSGNRRRALGFGLRAVFQLPWRFSAWRLLVCALAKPMWKAS